jgi:hypothetical protein
MSMVRGFAITAPFIGFETPMMLEESIYLLVASMYPLDAPGIAGLMDYRYALVEVYNGTPRKVPDEALYRATYTALDRNDIIPLVRENDALGNRQYMAAVYELRDACCRIIYNRQDYYYVPELPTPPELTEKQLNDLPDGEIKKSAIAQHGRHAREMRQYREELHQWEQLQKAATEGDLASAYFVL